MGDYKEELIEYRGIADYIPEILNSKKEINLEEIIEINNKNIEIDEIVKVSILGECSEARIIDTPIGVSIDGIRLTGKKALVCVNFIIRVEYISKQSPNKIYSIKVNRMIFTSVILELEQAIKRQNTTTMFIEDILARKIGTRDILIVVYGIIGVE